MTVDKRSNSGGSCKGVARGLWPAFGCGDEKGPLKLSDALCPADGKDGDDLAGTGVCVGGEMWKQAGVSLSTWGEGGSRGHTRQMMGTLGRRRGGCPSLRPRLHLGRRRSLRPGHRPLQGESVGGGPEQ